MEKLRVGIIGTGGIANSHARGYKANVDKAELVAVCDIVEESARSFAERHGFAEVFTDYKELLASGKVDCVSVCTPNYLHSPVSIEALRQGVHVLCEKPMATTIPDAEQMVPEAEKSGKVLYIGFNHRFIPNFYKGKEVVESRLGKLLAARVAVGHGMALRLQETWFAEKAKSGGGTLIDNGVHMIDMLRWYFGDIVEISAQTSRMVISKGDVEDNAIAIFRLAGGASASLQCSWTWWGGYHLYFEAICEKGVLTLDSGKCILYDTSQDHSTELELPSMDPWQEEISHFLEACAGLKPPFVTPQDGLEAVKVAVSAYESDRSGRALRIH